jgi:amino acid transporter
MQLNMGTLDRALRATVAIIIGLLYWMSYITGVIAIVLGVVGLILLLTAIVGWCPIYALFDLSTVEGGQPKTR